MSEEEDLEKMLGHFVDGEGGGSGRDVNENWEEHGDLMKEIRWTKENLEQTMQLLKDCVNVLAMFLICQHSACCTVYLWLQNGKNTCAGNLQGGGRGGSRQRAE